jgi:hypothetical protein
VKNQRTGKGDLHQAVTLFVWSPHVAWIHADQARQNVDPGRAAITDGEGGFGKVYLASNTKPEDAVAKFVQKAPGATVCAVSAFRGVDCIAC